MKKQLPAAVVLTVLFNCLAFCSFAQKNFTKGYYVTTQNDTVSCLVNDKNWQKSPTKIQYQLTEAGEVHTFNASEIKGFGLTSGDIFISEVVTIDQTSAYISNLQARTIPEAVTDTVFLRVLVRGAANLLFLFDGKRDHFYYQKDATSRPAELVLTYYMKDDPVSGRTGIAKKEKFRGQLMYYFSDCSKLSSELEHISYNMDALSKIFRKYNACVGNEQYVSQKEKQQLQFGIIGGPSATNLSFPRGHRPDLMGTNFKSPLSYNTGIALNIVLPRNRQKWSIYNEILWKPYSAKGHYEERLNSGFTSKTYDTEFQISSIGLGSMIRHQLPLLKFKPFIATGIANNLLLKFQDHQKYVVYYSYDSKGEIVEGPALPIYKKHEWAFLLGTGLSIKKATFEMRGEYGDGFSDGRHAFSQKISISFLFGYYFN